MFVDFPDGRLTDGSLPTQDSDTALVANIDAVGSMGYVFVNPQNPSLGFRKRIRKYVYEDYWNMFFSSNLYTGTVHPDYVTHQGYFPTGYPGGWSTQPYDLTVYGSVRDYWDEVSYGNFQIQAYETHSGGGDMYHTGIVNNLIIANAKNYIRWIKMPSNKTSYSFGSYTIASDVYARLDYLHSLPTTDPDYIEFNRSAFTGKIGIVTAGGQLGGWATFVGSREFVMPEKLGYLRNSSPSIVLDGITGLAHEFGHTIEFNHMAVGSYDLMHWGGYGDRRYYFCPPHINPRAKLQRGWLTTANNVVKISSSGAFSLSPITSSAPQVGIVTIYGDGGRDGNWDHSEYFILEYRKREKFSRFAGGMNPPQGFDGGILIWHYSSIGDFKSSFNSYDEANSGIIFHLGLKVQNYGTPFRGNSGDPSQLYYSGHNVIDQGTTPNTSSLENLTTGISLSNFTLSNGQISVSANYTLGGVPTYNQFYTSMASLPSSISGNVYIEGSKSPSSLTVQAGSQVDFSLATRITTADIVANAAGQASISFRGAGFGSNRVSWDGIISTNATVQNCVFTNFGYRSDSKALSVYNPTNSVTIGYNTFTDFNAQGTGMFQS